MDLFMANGKMGIPCFEGSWTLSSKYSINPSLCQGVSKISLSSISRIALNREKLKKNRIISGVTPGLIDSGRLIEKQVEFQPAFDEYLKAMESVKTGRENRPVKEANFRENSTGRDEERMDSGNEGEGSSEKSHLWTREKGVNNGKLGFGESGTIVATKTGRERKPVKDANFRDNSIFKDEEIMESGKAGEGSLEKSRLWVRQKTVDNTSNVGLKEGFSRKRGVGSVRDSNGRNKLGSGERSDGVMNGSGKLGGREDFIKKEGVESTRGSVHRKFEYRENDMDLSSDRRLEEDEVDVSFNKSNQRWIQGDNSKFVATKRTEVDRRTYRRSNAVKRLGSDDDLHGGDLDQERKYINMQKKQLDSNGTRVTAEVRNTERETIFTGSKWVPERQQSYRSGIESKTTESSLDRTLNDWERISKSDLEVEFGASESRKNTHTELSDRMEVDRRIYDSDTVIRSKSENSYENRSNIRPNRNMFEMEKFGFRSTKMRVELGRDHSDAETSRHNGSLKSGNFTRNGNFLKEVVGENDMDMERAAFKSFEVFTDLRGQPRVLRMEMEERIQNLAKWLNGTDINLPEWLFSKMIHSARIRFSDHSILRLIQILGTLGNWRRVLQVLEWLQSRERFKSYKTRYIYTAALDVLGKAKRPVEALNVFHAMREGVSSYPDLAAYHCIAVALGQAGYVKELFDVIDCMRCPPPDKFKTRLTEKWDPRLEPDIIVYNSVLNACARRKQWEGAFWVLQQLKQQGLQPSTTTYGLAMEVMFACEKYNLVYEFFKKVEKFTIPNTLNYKVLVNTLWKEDKTDDAMSAVKDMERRGIVGSASLYYDLARCLCSAGRCQEALMQMDKICKVAHKPLVVTYTGLIQACLDKGNIQDGAYIFNQMQEFCSPNLVTCNIMLRGYLEHKMFEDAKDLFQKMVHESSRITRRSDCKSIVTPDSYTFNTMLDACAAEQKWEDFRYVFQEMIRRGYNFNTKRHLGLILQACRAGEGELLETTWKHLVQYNRVPPPPLVKERFCIMLEKNEYTAAIASITSHPVDDLRLHAFSEKGWLDLLKTNTYRFRKDAIVSLTHKLNSLVAGTDRPHPIIRNLLSSCREFTRTHYIAAEINLSEMREHAYQT